MAARRGMTGGAVGISVGSTTELAGDVETTGTGTSTVVTGAVGELPPPHCVNAIALPSRRAIPNTGRRRKGIY